MPKGKPARCSTCCMRGESYNALGRAIVLPRCDLLISPRRGGSGRYATYIGVAYPYQVAALTTGALFPQQQDAEIQVGMVEAGFQFEGLLIFRDGFAIFAEQAVGQREMEMRGVIFGIRLNSLQEQLCGLLVLFRLAPSGLRRQSVAGANRRNQAATAAHISSFYLGGVRKKCFEETSQFRRKRLSGHAVLLSAKHGSFQKGVNRDFSRRRGTAGTRPSRCRCAPAGGHRPAPGGSRSCPPEPGSAPAP